MAQKIGRVEKAEIFKRKLGIINRGRDAAEAFIDKKDYAREEVYDQQDEIEDGWDQEKPVSAF